MRWRVWSAPPSGGWLKGKAEQDGIDAIPGGTDIGVGTVIKGD